MHQACRGAWRILVQRYFVFGALAERRREKGLSAGGYLDARKRNRQYCRPVTQANPRRCCKRSLLVVYSNGSLCPASHSAAPKAASVASWKPLRMSLRLPG